MRIPVRNAALASFALNLCVWPQGTPVMRTIAGGYLGDGGLATKAGIYEVRRVAVASDGTMYLADKSSHRVRRVTPDGRISTYAGTGESGFLGDGGPASAARFYFPEAVALDKAGNLYVADVSNARVRKITKEGIVSTYVGNGAEGGFQYNVSATSTSAGYPKSLTFADDGTLYVCDRDYYRVYKVSPQGILTLVIGNPSSATSTGDGGPATSATVSRPGSVVIGPDNSVYVSEWTGHRIRRIMPNGIVTTFAGAGTAGFADGPAATARFDGPDGMWMIGNDLYIADSNNNRIRRIRNGVVSTVAGTGEGGFAGDGGLATQARLRDPKGVGADQRGNLLINDVGNGRIRKLDLTTGIVTTIAGAGSSVPNGDGGPALGSFILSASGVWMENNGTLLVADAGRNRIRAIDRNGLVSTWAGSGEEGTLAGDLGPLSGARFWAPVRIVSDRRGTYYIVDRDNNRIRRVNPQGIVSTFAGSTRGNSGDDGPATSAQFNRMRSAAVHPLSNELYIADSENHCIRRVDLSGIVRRVAGTCGTSGFSGDGGDARSARMNLPSDLVFDSKGVLYVADSDNNRVRKIDNNGIITNYAGDGRVVWIEVMGENRNNPRLGYGGPALNAAVGSPQAVTVDKNDHLYIVATHNVTRVDPATGIITLLGGDGTYQFRGDGGPANRASLNNTTGIAVDSDLNVYLADQNNARIRMITTTSATTTVTIRTNPPGLRVLVDGQEVADGQQIGWIPNSSHQLSANRVVGSGNTRHVFASWSTGSQDLSTQVRAGTGTAVYTANFTPQHKLTLGVNGAGVVDANPPSEDGGYYNEGTVVQLTPAALADWSFAGFSGDVNGMDGGSVTMSAPRRVVAEFAAPKPELSVTPAQLTFQLQEGGPAPAEQLITVASTGSPLGFAATASAGFLRLDGAQNTTPAVIRVNINATGLTAGTHQANVTITSSDAASITIPVTVVVAPAPVRPTLQVTPTVMDINVSAADQSVARFIQASSSGDPLRLGWGVRTGAQWLVIRPENTSTTPAMFRLDVLPRGLPPGSHSGRIEITSPDSSNPSQVVLVNLTIEPEAPKQLFPSSQKISFEYRRKRQGPGSSSPPQQLDVTSNQSGLRFFARAAVSAPVPWLSVRSSDGSANPSAPGSLIITANGEGLEPGMHEGSVELRLEQSGDVIARVPVLLEVVAPAPVTLTSDRPDVRFDLPSGSTPQSVIWRIQNNGDEPVELSVSSSEESSAWLRVSGARTSASAENPGLILVGADTSSLSPGTYAGTVIAGAGETQLRLPVVLTVNPSNRKLVAAERSVRMVAKSGQSAGRFLDLLVDGQGSANWTATASTEKGGNWLSLNPSSGSVAGNQPQRATILASSLPAGTYTGRIRISSDQASNVEEVVVNLEVSASKDAPPDVDRAGIILVAQPGGGETNRVTVEAFYSKMAGRDMSISVQPPSWLRVSSNSVRLSSTVGLATFQIYASPAGLAVGVHQGTVMLTFADGQTSSIRVVLVVAAAGNAAPSVLSKSTKPAVDGCSPANYTSVFANPQGLGVQIGEAARTEFVVVNNCGQLLTGGAVSNSFSSGDRPVDLVSVGDGIWRASWTPRVGVESPIAVQLDVVGPAGALPVESPRLVTFLTGQSQAPILDRGVPFATPGQRDLSLAVAPGGRVIIRGERLSDSKIQSTSPVLQLGNTRVTLGGVPMEILSVSPTEIEALIPAGGLTQHVAHPLIVTRGTELSAPEMLSVADSWPTIVEAGASRAGGVDVVLTNVKASDAHRYEIQVDGVRCSMSALTPVQKEPGFFYARGVGCPATEGSSIVARIPNAAASVTPPATIRPQARRRPASGGVASEER
jgi:sugar lactone lactonase YvrE